MARHLCQVALALSGGLCVAPAAFAEEPWTLGLEQSLTRDSNLLRAPDGLPRLSDLRSRTSVDGGLVSLFGAQRLSAGASAHVDRYRDDTRLDNTGADGFAALEWQSLDRFSGLLRAHGARELAPFGIDGVAPGDVRNEQRSSDADVRLRLGLPTYDNLELALRHESLDYSVPAFASYELWQRSAGLSYHLRSGSVLPIVIGVRHTQGGYPHARVLAGGGPGADDFTRNDFDLSARWVPSGRSTLDLRTSATRERHADVAARDVTALTAALTWQYRPTPQFDLDLSALRDTGAGSAFLGIESDSATARDSGAAIAETLALAARWRPVTVLEWQAGVNWARRTLVDPAPGAAGSSATAGSDRTVAATLGLFFRPDPHWRLGCSVERDARSTASSASYPWHATVGACSVRYALR